MQLTYVEHSGTDLSVVNAARVSFGKKSDWEEYCPECGTVNPKKWFDYELTSNPNYIGECSNPRCTASWIKLRLVKKDIKLINYLATHEHFSPFNHCFLTCHVKAPIFVARQLVKHEYMPWNEISRRYVDDEPEFYWPDVWRGKSEDKKQGSNGNVILDNEISLQVSYGVEQSLFAYNDLLDAGVAPEQARMVLPLNTYTEWYWSGTLGAWMKMYNLRAKEDTQEETRTIANMAGEVLKTLYPVSFEALRKV